MATADDLIVKVRAEFEPPIEEVRRLSIRPGDVVVLKLSEYADPDMLRPRLEVTFPDNKVLVLAPGMDLYVVRPEEVGQHPGEVGVGGPFWASLKRLFRR